MSQFNFIAGYLSCQHKKDGGGLTRRGYFSRFQPTPIYGGVEAIWYPTKHMAISMTHEEALAIVDKWIEPNGLLFKFHTKLSSHG